MQITDQQRDEAFVTASMIHKDLYTSPTSGQKLFEIASKHGIVNRSQYAQFATLVGDVILGFYSSTQLPTLLTATCNLSEKAAFAVTADILDFLAPLDHSDHASLDNLQDEIIETEAVLSSLPKSLVPQTKPTPSPDTTPLRPHQPARPVAAPAPKMPTQAPVVPNPAPKAPSAPQQSFTPVGGPPSPAAVDTLPTIPAPSNTPATPTPTTTATEPTYTSTQAAILQEGEKGQTRI